MFSGGEKADALFGMFKSALAADESHAITVEILTEFSDF